MLKVYLPKANAMKQIHNHSAFISVRNGTVPRAESILGEAKGPLTRVP